MKKNIFILTILILSSCLINSKHREMENKTHTVFLPRSLGMNTAHWLTSYRQVLPGCDEYADSFWKILVEYGQSFRGDQISKYLFGGNKLRFTGSAVRNRKSTDLLADYLGLPTTYQGTIHFNPKIENILISLTYRLLLDKWFPGGYFQVNAPIAVTRTFLGITEKRSKKPNLSLLPAGYMAPDEVRPASSICQALSGNFLFGDMKEPWDFGRFTPRMQQRYGLAGLNLFLGWNWEANINRHLGAYILVVAPTGSKIRSRRVFSPVIGNGNMWELGLGTEGHYSFIKNDDHDFGIWFNGVFTHQFKTDQIRTFGLKNKGRLSQYMLLKRLEAPNHIDELVNGVDFATRAVRVGGSMLGDASIKLAYYYSKFGVETGYNVYGKSREKLFLMCDIYPSDLNHKLFGLKGTSGSYYKNGGEFHRLNSTQNDANIHRGGDVDNPEQIPGRTYNNRTVFRSNPPVPLSVNDLDIETGIIPPQLSHKFFVRLGYLDFKACYEPQLGIGGQVEFNGKRNDALLNIWTVWIDGSLAF